MNNMDFHLTGMEFDRSVHPDDSIFRGIVIDNKVHLQSVY